MKKKNKDKNPVTKTKTRGTVLTQFPGIDNSQVIPSYPIYIKENSYKELTDEQMIRKGLK